MAEDVGLMQNACCAELKKKHAKLLEKYSKLEELKNKFRSCTALVQEKYDALEMENVNLKKAFDELKVQADMWKDEKEKECGIRQDLEDGISALKDEVQLLKCNGNSGSQEANEQLQERLNAADKEIKRLKELLDKERRKMTSEKKNAELEKKKADEALKKLEMDKNKVSEAQKMANVERTRAEDNRLLWEKLSKETDAVKLKLALEKSKSESAYKRVEVEKQNAITEKERADVAVAKAEEQRQLAEMNLKKAACEKDRADDYNRKFEEASNRAKKLEEELRRLLCSGKFVETQVDASDATMKNDVVISHRMEKVLLQKKHNIIREKKHADSEKMVAKKWKKDANNYKKMAREEKHRADKLSKELESCKLRLEELQKELVKSYSHRMYTANSSLRYNNITSETVIVKKLKNQLKLEKMLVKHAKRVSEVEAIRNSMLHQELVQLKQEFLQFQLRFDMLSNSFLHSGEGIHQWEKIGNHISTRETLCSDDCHGQLISGTNSGLDPPHRGSNPKMLQSSAINSSSASFSDRPLVGSQEIHTLSVASAKLGEDTSKLKPNSKLSAKTGIRHNDCTVVNADNVTKRSVKENANKRRIGSRERERILDAVKSIENLYSKGEKLHQQVSKKVFLLHDILNGKKDEAEEENLKDNSCKALVRPFKRRKTSSEGTIVTHDTQENEKAKSNFDSNVDHSNACMAALPKGLDAMKLDPYIQDGTNSIFRSNQCNSQPFDMMSGYDYMKLLDLDSAADEDSYRRAIAMPLSPLPLDIESLVDEKLGVDNPQMLHNKSSLGGLTGVGGSMELSSSIHVINSDTEDINAVLEGEKLRKPDLTDSGPKEANMLHDRGSSEPPGCFLKHYVIFSDNKDNHSILRILQAVSSCMPHCSSLDSADIFVQSILHALLNACDLSMKEKVCAFFSLVLHGISELQTKYWSNVLSYDLVQSLNSVTQHICSAIMDPVLRKKFTESCDIFELLALIEDFLLQRKVFVSGHGSSEPEGLSSSKVDLCLNGDVVMLSEVVASAPLLVVGGSLLSSLCLAVDQIGHICEMSCNIIMIPKCDPAIMLAVLHTFANVCGSKYFTLQQYSLAMTVIKTVVMFLEKKSLSAASPSISPSVGDLSVSWLCCSNCLFSKDALPMEDVALMLLENLHKHSQSLSWSKDTLEVVKSLVPRARLHEYRNENISHFTESVSSVSTYDDNFCEFIDILSLMEILASFMSWNWTVDRIVAPIGEFLELHIMEGFSAAVIILLGQLGRFGVETSGYEDPAVRSLRERLSTFLCQTSFLKFSLPVQFALVTSLLTLTTIKFEDIVDDKVESRAVTSQCFPTALIRKWFSLLSYEQQSHFRLSLSCSSNREQFLLLRDVF